MAAKFISAVNHVKRRDMAGEAFHFNPFVFSLPVHHVTDKNPYRQAESQPALCLRRL